MTTTKSKRTQKSAVAKAIVFDHARTDPSHCLADGLFRPILHGKREESPLDVSYKFKNVLFRWQNPTTALCIKDQGVFLAIHRIAADKSRVTKVGISHSDADQLAARNALDLELEANNLECLVITTTAREIAHILGLMISGPAISRVQASLERLAGVSFAISYPEQEKTFWKAKLISIVPLDGPNRLIAFNPILSKALAGTPTAYIDMKEQLCLPSDASKRLHVWLSAWLRPTEGKRIGRDLLVKHVWGSTGIGDTLYSRRNAIKVALEAMNQNTAWRCEYDEASESYFIQRKKLGDYEEGSPGVQQL